MNGIKVIFLIFSLSVIKSRLPQECLNFCNECDEFKDECEECASYGNRTLKINNVCIVSGFYNKISSCSNTILFNKNDYECSNNNSLKIENCRVVDNNSNCKFCKTEAISKNSQNYYWNGSKCIPVSRNIKFCRKYKDASSCEKCTLGYKLSNSLCIENIVKCSTFNKNTNGQCTQCDNSNEYISKDGLNCIIGYNSIIIINVLLLIISLL